MVKKVQFLDAIVSMQLLEVLNVYERLRFIGVIVRVFEHEKEDVLVKNFVTLSN